VADQKPQDHTPEGIPSLVHSKDGPLVLLEPYAVELLVRVEQLEPLGKYFRI
jgi:hypothetical protein